MIELLKLAGQIALTTDDNDARNFWLGAVGIRKDGTQVSARNGAVFTTTSDYKVVALAHAETRLCRKLDKHSVVYVSRISRKDFSYAMARPCAVCRIILKANAVQKVYYTIDNSSYGIWYPSSNTDVVCT